MIGRFLIKEEESIPVISRPKLVADEIAS